MLKYIRLAYEKRNSFNCNRLSTGEYSRALKSERSTILYTEIYLEMFYELLISFSTTDITVMMYTCLRKCDFNGCSVPVWNLIDSWKLCFQMLFSINFRDTRVKEKRHIKCRDWKWAPFIPILIFNEIAYGYVYVDYASTLTMGHFS